jgi:hypothetical protein
MSFTPWINWQFHKSPGLIDPRASFVRATTGRIINRVGLTAPVVANAARFRFNPTTRISEGLLVEGQRTNLLLRSEEFDNASWVKTDATVTANTAVAPDGATTGDAVAVTAAGGSVAQAFNIIAGRGIALSVYAKASASAWLRLSLTDGANMVEAWFNLGSGAVGSSTAGGGTNIFSTARAEDGGNGWWRCSLATTTNTSTAFTAGIAPVAADGAAPANGHAALLWGAQAEAEFTLTAESSYIPTVAAAVTRNADNLFMPVTAAQFPLDRGTMVFDMIMRPLVPPSGGPSVVVGGAGDTFSNTVYVSRSGATSLGVNWISGGVGGNLITRPVSIVPGTLFRLGITWQPGRIALCIDGGAITSTTNNIVPLVSVARIAVGMAPWSTTSAGTVSNMVHRAFIYAPQVVTDALLQQLTAP